MSFSEPSYDNQNTPQSLQLGQRETYGEASYFTLFILLNLYVVIKKFNCLVKGHLRLVCVLFERETFKWCCRYFDGNLDKLFSECHVINPSKKPKTRPMSTRSSSQDMPCQICYLNYPNSVSVSSDHLFTSTAPKSSSVP